jgi:hypothetical protein
MKKMTSSENHLFRFEFKAKMKQNETIPLYETKKSNYFDLSTTSNDNKVNSGSQSCLFAVLLEILFLCFRVLSILIGWSVLLGNENLQKEPRQQNRNEVLFGITIL